ncbi:uncharacterized protein DS421_13g418020 [Arachis hypogaea]|nr:uncharacterized protein DS421_13g418020 [Arachis hypogaea]
MVQFSTSIRMKKHGRKERKGEGGRKSCDRGREGRDDATAKARRCHTVLGPLRAPPRLAARTARRTEVRVREKWRARGRRFVRRRSHFVTTVEVLTIAVNGGRRREDERRLAAVPAEPPPPLGFYRRHLCHCRRARSQRRRKSDVVPCRIARGCRAATAVQGKSAAAVREATLLRVRTEVRERESCEGVDFLRRCQAMTAVLEVAVAAAWVLVVQATIDGASFLLLWSVEGGAHGWKKANRGREAPLSGGRSATVDPPEFLAAAGAVAAAGLKSQLLRVVIPFGLRRKGLDEAFGLWNCVLR